MSFSSEGCIAAFELAAELGYPEQIRNRVVDALGDVSGCTRISNVGTTRVDESEGAR
jgi:hypothetical protein